ncbi:MAG: DNA internalization-related competence protein ComEC/Rec2 [Polyangiaceae bacterium]
MVASLAAFGAPLALHPWPAALALLAGLALCAHRRLSPGLLVVGALLASLGAFRTYRALEAAERDHDRLVAALDEPARCVLTGTVERSPVVIRTGAPRDGPPEHDARFELRVEEGDCEADRDGRVPIVPAASLVRIYGGPEDLVRGDRIEAVASLAPVRLFHNPGLTDPYVRLALTDIIASGGAVDVLVLDRGRGLAARIDAARRHVRRRIDATYAAESAPYGRALVLGETDLPDDERDAFRRSGLAHLLAVSGTHLVIAVLALVTALRALMCRLTFLSARLDVGRISALVGAVASWLYADFAGGGGSAYRAAAMMSAALLIRAFGRRPSGLRCFAWSLLGGVLLEPLAVCDLSFVLSVAATAGLLVAASPLRRLVQNRATVVKVLLLSTGATVSAVVACAPILLGVGPELPIVGVAANLLASPVGELVALPVCLLHAVLAWAPGAEQGAAMVGGGALLLVRAFAQAAADSPWASLSLPPPTAWQLGVLAVAAVALGLRHRPRTVALATLLCLVAFELLARHRGAPTGELRVTVLDVGQGDAILVDLPDGRLMMVDGGGFVGSPLDPAERVVLPVLRHRRRDRVDIAVLSHPHPDHYTGLLTVLDTLPVDELWTSGLALSWGPGSRLGQAFRAASTEGTRLRTARELCGDHPVERGVIEVLGPCPSFVPDRHVNDNSLVLRIRLGGRAVLLTGDAEREQEQSLLARHPEALSADLLKVGHHGSRTSSTPAFLAAVSPALAIASCGVRNRFGHPHPQTRDTFGEADVPLLLTERGGALIWRTDGEAVTWERP